MIEETGPRKEHLVLTLNKVSVSLMLRGSLGKIPQSQKGGFSPQLVNSSAFELWFVGVFFSMSFNMAGGERGCDLVLFCFFPPSDTSATQPGSVGYSLL